MARSFDDIRSAASTRIRILVGEQLHRADQFEADAARADHAQHRRHADVGFESIEHDANPGGHDLRQHAEHDALQGACAGRAQRIERTLVDLLDRLGEELAQHAGAVQRDGEHAREGTEADGGDEDQRQDDLVDAAHHVQDLTQPMEHPGIGREVPGGEEAHRQGQYDAEQGTPQRDLHGLDGGLHQLLHEGEVGRQHAADEVADPRQPVDEARYAETRADGRPPEGSDRKAPDRDHDPPAERTARLVDDELQGHC